MMVIENADMKPGGRIQKSDNRSWPDSFKVVIMLMLISLKLVAYLYIIGKHYAMYF